MGGTAIRASQLITLTNNFIIAGGGGGGGGGGGYYACGQFEPSPCQTCTTSPVNSTCVATPQYARCTSCDGNIRGCDSLDTFVSVNKLCYRNCSSATLQSYQVRNVTRTTTTCVPRTCNCILPFNYSGGNGGVGYGLNTSYVLNYGRGLGGAGLGAGAGGDGGTTYAAKGSNGVTSSNPSGVGGLGGDGGYSITGSSNITYINNGVTYGVIYPIAI
jgi:hypothetical protein